MTLLCGDCGVLLKSLAPESVDLTVTSPPYDNLREYDGYSWDFPTVASELWRVTAEGGGGRMGGRRRDREGE